MPIPNLPVWTYEPNWAERFSETLEWMTSVLTSIDGTEQRFAKRALPRRSYEFGIVTQASDRTGYDAEMRLFGVSEWLLPLWFDITFTDGPVTQGARFIPCRDAMTSTLTVGSMAYLTGADLRSGQAVRIKSIDHYGVSIESPVAGSRPAGSRLYPLVRARLTDQPELRSYSTNLLAGNVRLMEVNDRPPPLTGNRVATTFPNYRGDPLVTTHPERHERLNMSYERIVETIDNGTGNPLVIDTAGQAFDLQDFTWLLQGRDQQHSFRTLLDSMQGRLRPIWMPTWQDDFSLINNITAGDIRISVERSGHDRGSIPAPGREDIMIETLGMKICRRIIGTENLPGGGLELRLDQPMDVGIYSGLPIRISFIRKMRLNHDAVELTHYSDTHGTSGCRATFREIID